MNQFFRYYVLRVRQECGEINMKIKTLKAIVISMTVVAAFSASSVFAKKYDVRGKTMEQVRALYGDPISIKGPVGGFSETRPPITEWQYTDFFITFEREIALHGNSADSLTLELDSK